MNARPGPVPPERTLNVAVIGSGISGLSAAWLLSKRHRVTLFEAEPRLGGHSHTVEVAGTPVDTGFIVYNEATYPNLTALFATLGVDTRATDMSFAVSLDGGRLEYAGTGLRGLFAQPRNITSPRFWRMLRDLLRFYRIAPRDISSAGHQSLTDYLDSRGFGAAFRHDHLFPMAAAIWSTPAGQIGRYPAAAFIRFCENHGLLKLLQRPIWRTVDGGSRQYVARMAADLAGCVRLGEPVEQVRRLGQGVEVTTLSSGTERFDHVIVATHADQALRLLGDPSKEEQDLLGAFSYTSNQAVLHADAGLMPRARAAWAAWNYLSDGSGAEQRLSVTYWMNQLQGIPGSQPLFVTLNPSRTPAPEAVLHTQTYRHPLFDLKALDAQERLWSLQGARHTWFCGAYFGSGFHEDGLQAGLAVAELLGGVRRPWTVAKESDRICLNAPVAPPVDLELA